MDGTTRLSIRTISFYEKLVALWKGQSAWSAQTFGRASVRGPVGPLKHLAREAMEAAENPADIAEYADCVLLMIDAVRRSGFTAEQVVDAAAEKLQANKLRTWPAPTDMAANEPVEHVR